MNRVWIVAVIALLVGIAAVAVVFRQPFAQPDAPGSPVDARQNIGAASTAQSGLPAQSGRRPAKPTVPELSGESAKTALLGNVVAPTQATVTVRVPSRIRRVLTREGETVRANQPIFDLDDTEYLSQEESARAGVTTAQAQVDRARAGLRAQQTKARADVDAARGALNQSQIKLQQALLARRAAEDEQKADLRAANEAVNKAQIAYDRAKETQRGLEDLAKVGGVSRSDLEGARTQTNLALSDLNSAKSQVARAQAGSGGVSYKVAAADKDVDAARDAVAQAKQGVKTAETGAKQSVSIAAQEVRAADAGLNQAAVGVSGARAARSQLVLTSPINGLVTSITARAGEVAQPASPLATIVSLAGLRVDALAPARLLNFLHNGQTAHVSVDTAPGRAFNAVVSEIARIAEPDGRTFRVKFRLLGSPPLIPGQTARIKVLTSR
jgi:multidrug resistance efflux pump